MEEIRTRRDASGTKACHIATLINGLGALPPPLMRKAKDVQLSVRPIDTRAPEVWYGPCQKSLQKDAVASSGRER